MSLATIAPAKSRAERLELLRSLKPLLLVNPHARHGKDGLVRAYQHLCDAGLRPYEAIPLGSPEDLSPLIRAALGDGVRLVLVGGGDGTLSAAAQCMARSSAILGVLPLGTGNDFSRSLGIPHSLEAAVQAVTDGAPAAVDLGECNGRFFLNAATVGFSSRVTERLTSPLKRRAGPLAYPIAASRELGALRPFRALLRNGGGTLELLLMQLTIGNGRFHGGGSIVSPSATLDDHRLHVYGIVASADASGGRARVRDYLALAKVVLGVRRGEHVSASEVIDLRVEHLEVEAEPAQFVDVDGERLGTTPLELGVAPGVLWVMLPPGSPFLHADSATFPVH